MPTYEYECLPNRHRFEVKQSFTDAALDACQVCGEPVRKVISAAGLVFKGSGYYVTDTRSAAKSGSDAAKSESSKSESSKSESKSESSKSESKSSDSSGSSSGSSGSSGDRKSASTSAKSSTSSSSD